MTNTNWRDRAACGMGDAGLFFPGPNTSTAEVKRLCPSCPVRAACLQDALDSNDVSAGIRAGKSADERRALLREQPKPAKVDHTGDIARLHAKRWTRPAIALRLGVDIGVVDRALKAHREQGTAA
jgi:WhiB family transcriptional regulator, redox-sensing transcriptional regulator